MKVTVQFGDGKKRPETRRKWYVALGAIAILTAVACGLMWLAGAPKCQTTDAFDEGLEEVQQAATEHAANAVLVGAQSFGPFDGGESSWRYYYVSRQKVNSFSVERTGDGVSVVAGARVALTREQVESVDDVSDVIDAKQALDIMRAAAPRHSELSCLSLTLYDADAAEQNPVWKATFVGESDNATVLTIDASR